MRYLEIVLLIGFFLNGQGVFGKQLQWNTRLSRKLLLEGEAVTDKDDKMFVVSAGGREFTGIGLKGKTIAIPSIHVKTAKIKSKTLSSKGTSGGFTFFGYDNAKQFADYASATGGLTKCFIYGFKEVDGVPVEIISTTGNGIHIRAKTGQICNSELGGALLCNNLLAGLVKEQLEPTIIPKAAPQTAPPAVPITAPATVPTLGEITTPKENEEVLVETTTEEIPTVPGTDKPPDLETPPPKAIRKRAVDVSCSTDYLVTPIHEIKLLEPITKQVSRREKGGDGGGSGAKQIINNWFWNTLLFITINLFAVFVYHI